MPKGDVWGTVRCPECGDSIDVIETRKGTGTWYCPTCKHRGFFNKSRDDFEAKASPTDDGDDDGHEGRDRDGDAGSDDLGSFYGF